MKFYVLFLSIVLNAAILHARPVRDIFLERDIPKAEVVALVKVEQLSTSATAVEFGQFKVNELNISCKVLHSLKGSFTSGDTLNFLHRKASTFAQAIEINAFSSFHFQQDKNYLLILAQDSDGTLQLPAPEANSIPLFSDKLIAQITVHKETQPLAQVMDLLLLSLFYENEPPEYSIKSLQMLHHTRFFRDKLEKEEFKYKVVQRLIQIKERSTKWRNLSAAHFYLPEFGEYSFWDQAIDFILDENNSESNRYNAISTWFQNYPEDLELKAYRKIIRQCENDFVRKGAQYRLSYLWDLPEDIEIEFQKLLQPGSVTSDTGKIIEFMNKQINSDRARGLIPPSEFDNFWQLYQNLQQKFNIRLKVALSSEHPETRIIAALTLHKLHDDTGVQVLINDYQSENANHRATVIEALRTIKDKRAVEVFIKACSDKSPYIRGTAIAALGEMGVVDSIPIICKHLEDKEKPEGKATSLLPAQQACYALGLLRTPDVIEPLIKALDDDDLQQQAILALKQCRTYGVNTYNLASIQFREQVGNSQTSVSYPVPSLQFPEDPADDPVKWKRWGKWYLLKKEKINVRIYSNWKQSPDDYTIVQTGVNDSHAVDFAGVKIAQDSAVVITHHDQDNPVLKQILKKVIYAEQGNKLSAMRIPYYDNLDRSDIASYLEKIPTWYFNDAFNQPIQDANVEVFLFSYKGPRIKIAAHQTDGSLNNFYVHGSIMVKEFVVSHPDYGIAAAPISQNLFGARPEVILPLVECNSDAAVRAVWGLVLDSEGNPIANAQIECSQLMALGGRPKHVMAHSHRIRSLTDTTGYFRHYIPLGIHKEPFKLDTEMISRKSTYSIEVTHPDIKYAQFTGKALNGKETIIELRHKDITEFSANLRDVEQKRFHKFEFYNQNGQITSPRDINNIQIEITRPNKPKVTVKGSQIQKGIDVPNGTYTAGLKNIFTHRLRYFSTLQVSGDSPETLVFSMPLRTYTGRALHAHTNEPMEGVFVLAHRGNRKGNLSMITDQQWEKLHLLPDNPSINDPALKPVSNMFTFENVVRTGPDGRFEMICPEGDAPYGFTFFDQNYIGLMHRSYKLKANENGIFEVPTKKMYPAATVFFQANSKQKHISICPRWVINKYNNPTWVTEMLKNDDRSQKFFVYNKWIEHNEPQSVYVPADTKLKLQLQTPYEDHISNYTFPQQIFLAQGQSVNVGQCQFQEKIPFYIKVVDSQGNPLDGVPVRKKRGNSYDISVVTGSNGMVKLFAASGSKGLAAVCAWDFEDHSDMRTIDTIDYHINSPQEAGKVYTLQLSQELVELLLKN